MRKCPTSSYTNWQANVWWHKRPATYSVTSDSDKTSTHDFFHWQSSQSKSRSVSFWLNCQESHQQQVLVKFYIHISPEMAHAAHRKGLLPVSADLCCMVICILIEGRCAGVLVAVWWTAALTVGIGWQYPWARQLLFLYLSYSFIREWSKGNSSL